jgi:mono/diheme cytochrome c family protein
VALLLEILDWRGTRKELRGGINLLVWIGAGSAVIAVALGLLLANQEDYGGDTLTYHQWSGIATMSLSLLALVLLRMGRLRWYRGTLILTVVGVSVAGHLGAMLTHGDDYLSSVLPGANDATAPGSSTPTFVLTSNDQPLSAKQVEDLNLEVRSILAHNCYSCHGASKSKGELRLDKKEFVMQGGEDGPVVVPGKPEKSEMIRRITLPTGHKEAMPTKGKRLSAQEVAVLEFWIKQGAPWPSGEEKSLFRVAPLAPRTPVLPPATAGLTNPVDRFVNVYFQENKVAWEKVVSDRIYIRRVFLDVIGLLPPPARVQAFLTDRRPDKRELLVKELLARDTDYAQHWITFWNDALRNDYSGTGYITGGRFDMTKWLYKSLKTNKPYNWFVRELISPQEESAGFIKGIKWRGTINSSQRTEMQAAQNVSQVLLGLNLKCASCHDSFVSDWKLADAYAFANVFADTLLEINRCDQPTGKMAGRQILFKELGEISIDAPTEERLRELADFLVKPEDGRLYRTLVNRIWAQLMGRGIVEPVDVMDNLPWSQDLLDWLATDFVQNGYDIKKLMYTILTSKTYQLPSVAVQEPDLLMSPSYVFQGMVRRRITAEQFADAVSTTFNPIYTDSAIVYKRFPETMPQQVRFPRASLVKNDPFQTALGRPNRETVSTSRTSQASLLQALELTNGELLNASIKTGAKRWKARFPQSDQLIRALYQRTLSRNPMPREIAVAEKIIGKQPSEEGIQDLAWAIVLHPEFQLIY